MSRQLTPQKMQQIVALRALQRLAAEADLARASLALSQERAAAIRAEEERDRTREGWLEAITTPSLPLEIAPYWAHALLRQDTLLDRAKREEEQAAESQRLRANALAQADHRKEHAEEMSRRIRRSHRNKRDEKALHDVQDRHMRQRLKP